MKVLTVMNSLNILQVLRERPGVGTGLTRSPWWKWATPRERARCGAILGRLVWAAKQLLGNAALGPLFA